MTKETGINLDQAIPKPAYEEDRLHLEGGTKLCIVYVKFMPGKEKKRIVYINSLIDGTLYKYRYMGVVVSNKVQELMDNGFVNDDGTLNNPVLCVTNARTNDKGQEYLELIGRAPDE